MSIYNRAPKKKKRGPYKVDVERDSSLYIGLYRTRGVQAVCLSCRRTCKVLKADRSKFFCYVFEQQ